VNDPGRVAGSTSVPYELWPFIIISRRNPRPSGMRFHWTGVQASRLLLETTPTPAPKPSAVGAFDTYQFLGGLSSVATTLAVIVGIAAAWIAVRQLTVSAESAKLAAVLETNQRWRLVRDAQLNVRLRSATLAAVDNHYSSLGLASVLSPSIPTELTEKAPKILGVLQPKNYLSAEEAPMNSTSYNLALVARATIFGSLINFLSARAESDDEIKEDLAALTAAVVAWVNQLNELAEMYGERLVDRRLLIGKIHIDLSRSIWYAEPYILWRNTAYPGRWGLRLLAFGQEAREYHWTSPLQNSPVMEDTDILELGPEANYPGYCRTLGWMYGSGESDVKRVRRSERSIRRKLGAGFTLDARQRQLELISELPTTTALAVSDRAHNGVWETMGPNDSRTDAAKKTLGL
jgi:hypothetical protein